MFLSSAMVRIILDITMWNIDLIEEENLVVMSVGIN